MRKRASSYRLGMVAAVLAFVAGTAAPASAQTVVNLVARPFDKIITLQNGTTTASVPMWGYGLAPDATCDASADSIPVSSPGPRIPMSAADTGLTISLCNRLPVATSLIIPGLPSPGVPSRPDGIRAASFTTEVPAGSAGVYSWSNVRPGTYLYQTGSHVQVQVQMGLYGAVTKDAATGEAYPGKPYAAEALLIYSEVDPVLHNAVDSGAYGGRVIIPGRDGTVASKPAMTSTFNYEPRYFLVNGDSYNPARAAMPAVAGSPALIRMLNAGLRTHVPTIQSGDFELLAEDAHPDRHGARRQYQVSLLVGKTVDVLWTPSAPGTVAIYDRSPHLTVNGRGVGGMIATFAVEGAAAVTLVDDQYQARTDIQLIVPAPGVMGNDSSQVGPALLVADVPAGQGTLALAADGSFTYTSGGYVGTTTFTYTQGSAAPATVTITVAENAAPVANAQSVATQPGTAVDITLTGSDPNGDALTFAIVAGSGPTGGTLTPTSPPSAVYTYTPNTGTTSDSFRFTVSDGTLTSPEATVNITVAGENTAPIATNTPLTVAEDTPTVVTLLATDAETPAGLTFTITTQPANGTVTPTATANEFTYAPNANFFGTDSFRFTASDGELESQVATATVTVTAVRDDPTALPDTYPHVTGNTTLNVMANDKSLDGLALTIQGVVDCTSYPCTVSSAGDTVSLNSARTLLTFRPANVPRNFNQRRTVTFNYQVTDGTGADARVSAPATVTVTIYR